MSTRRTRQSKGKLEDPIEIPIEDTSKTTRKKAIKRPPYRLAVKKRSPYGAETTVDISPYLIAPKTVTTPPDYDSQEDDNGTDIQGAIHSSQILERLDSRLRHSIGADNRKKNNLGSRLMSAGKKISPMMLVLLSTVLAAPVLVGIGLSKYNSNGTRSDVFDRYGRFSHDMLVLQKQYMHQSSWLWHGLRITAWMALAEPLHTMPIGVLMGIPHGQEEVGHSIATSAIDSFNKVHDQKSTLMVSCNNGTEDHSQNETNAYNKQLSLAIREARRAHQSAVLINNLEKLDNASLPILDKFLDVEDNAAENKMLIFTINLPTADCNPDFLRNFLVEDWISQVFARPTIARKLVDNMVFITPEGVKDK